MPGICNSDHILSDTCCWAHSLGRCSWAKTQPNAWPCGGLPSRAAESSISNVVQAPRPNPVAWLGISPQPPPDPSLFSTGPASPATQSLTSIGQPLTSIGQTPHFYQPSQAASCRTVSDRVGAVSAPCRTVPCQAGPCRRVGLTLAHP